MPSPRSLSNKSFKNKKATKIQALFRGRKRDENYKSYKKLK